jgi:hypothetical protein
MRNSSALPQERVGHDYDRIKWAAIRSKRNKGDNFQVQVLWKN